MQLPPVAENYAGGQPPAPPPLPPPLPQGGLPPAPPPLPPAVAGPGGGLDGPAGRGALFPSSTDGKKLKKVERPTPDTSVGGGNELLEAIRYVGVLGKGSNIIIGLSLAPVGGSFCRPGS